jgi:hypothetical protein
MINMIIKNTGLTPAYDVDVLGGAFLDAFPGIYNVRYERLRSGDRSDLVLGAGATDPIPIVIENANRPLTSEQKCLLNNGRTAIYLVGEIIYRDTFSILWCTRFAYYIGGDAGFYGIGMSIAPGKQKADKNCHEPTQGEPARVLIFPKPDPP